MGMYLGNPTLGSNALREQGYAESRGFDNVVDAVAYGKLGLVEGNWIDYKVLNAGARSYPRFRVYVRYAPYRPMNNFRLF